MSGKRQKIQYSLALEPVDQGETPVSGYQGTRTIRGETNIRKPGFRRAIDGGGVRARESRKSVETCSKATRAVLAWMG